MAYYTEKQRKTVLLQLHLNPECERVTGAEGAKILTWRAKKEFHVEQIYTPHTLQKHAPKLDAQPALKQDGTLNTRANTYSVVKLFELAIVPARTNAGARK